MPGENDSELIRRGGPLETAQERRQTAQGQAVPPEEVEAAAKRAKAGEAMSRKFYENKDSDNKKRIADLERQLKGINDFLYGRTKFYPLPVESSGKPKTREELAQTAREIGDELRELKGIK